MPRRRQSARPGSRARIFAAAAAEFAAHGYAAGIDRIARRARLNKAMIYYHFRDKQALYRAILREMEIALNTRLAAITASSDPPDRKLAAFLEALIEEADRRPYFPPIMLREIAEGAPRFDNEMLRLLGGLFRSVVGILADGTKQGLLNPVHPVVGYFSLMAPTVLYVASAGLRARLKPVRVMELSELTARDFAALLHGVVVRGLTKDHTS